MVILDAKIFDNGSQRPPIAPPRKKRITLKRGATLPETTTSDYIHNGGFKDVFGTIVPVSVRRSSYDDIEFIDKSDDLLQRRAVSDINFNRSSVSPDKKLKVGNKKSDKFFGENLSDSLSDEPMSLDDNTRNIDDSLTKSNEQLVADHEWHHCETFNNSLDKKAEFLMTMLDEHDKEDEEKYKDRTPVEEPLFVARKKIIRRHICDDDEHMHNTHFHDHEKESCDLKGQDEPNANDKSQAPPKPDRDFSKYIPIESEKKIDEEKSNMEKSSEVTGEKNNLKQLSPILAPLKINKVISRESLPTPPATPKRKSGIESTNFQAGTPGTPTIKIESIDFVTSTPHAEDLMKEDTDRKRPPPLELGITSETPKLGNEIPSTTPILAHELVDQMIKKAYGFHDYHPEENEHMDATDGSDQVAPTSKLTIRKVSTGNTRKISTGCSPSPSSESSSSEIVQPPSSPSVKKLSANEDSLHIIDENASKKVAPSGSPRTPRSPMRRDFNKLLSNPSMSDIIDEIYSKNSQIMEDFQSYLEQTIEKEPKINVDDEKEFLAKKGNEYIAETVAPVEKPTSSRKQTIMKCDEDEFDNQSFSDSFESSDNESACARANYDKHENIIPKVAIRRRESIEDVDTWFTQHLDLEEKKSHFESQESIDVAQLNVSTYDTQKIFPFGRTIIGRRDSLSDEFFSEPTNHLLKPRFDSLRESDGSAEDDKDATATKSTDTSFRKKSPDHSTLLKYFDKNEPVEKNVH